MARPPTSRAPSRGMLAAGGCLLVGIASLSTPADAFSTAPLHTRRSLASLALSPRLPPQLSPAPRARGSASPRMQGGSTDFLSSYKPPKEQFLDFENPPPVEDLTDDTRMLYEDTGVIVDGRWATKEEMQATVSEWLPGGWPDSAWPLGSPDVGHIGGGERLVDESVGGDPSLFPLGPPEVVCYGEALLDLIADSPAVKMGDPADKWTAFPGGAPINVAAALAKLGTPSAFIGSLGADADGDRLMEVIKKAKLPSVCVERDAEGRKTRNVFVTRDIEGDREFAGFSGPNDGFADCATDMEKMDGTLFYSANWCVTGTLGLAFPSSRVAMMEVREQCRFLDMIRVTDVNYRPVFWEGNKNAKEEILKFLGGTSILKATADEVEFLFGIDRNLALEQPYQVLKTMGPECLGVLITDGPGGVAYSFGSHGGRMDAFTIPVVDSTGAGDAFTAGFIHQSIALMDEFQEEEVDLGEDDTFPRAHMPVKERLVECFKDKERLADAVVFASAVGAATCMEEGAIDAQPTLRFAERMVDTYGDELTVLEEGKRDFELPDLKKQWWDWRYSGQ